MSQWRTCARMRSRTFTCVCLYRRRWHETHAWWSSATDGGRSRWLFVASPSFEEGPRWPSAVTGWHALMRLRASRWLFLAPTLLPRVEDGTSRWLRRRRSLVADGTSRRRSLLQSHMPMYIVVHRSVREKAYGGPWPPSPAVVTATIQLVFRSVTIRSHTIPL